jgi:hypothetical protein
MGNGKRNGKGSGSLGRVFITRWMSSILTSARFDSDFCSSFCFLTAGWCILGAKWCDRGLLVGEEWLFLTIASFPTTASNLFAVTSSVIFNLK